MQNQAMPVGSRLRDSKILIAKICIGAQLLTIWIFSVHMIWHLPAVSILALLAVAINPKLANQWLQIISNMQFQCVLPIKMHHIRFRQPGRTKSLNKDQPAAKVVLITLHQKDLTVICKWAKKFRKIALSAYPAANV